METEARKFGSEDEDAGYASLISDKNLRFPANPTFLPDLRIFELPDGLGFFIRGSAEPVLLRGREVGPALNYLRKALTGETSFDELLAQRPNGLTKAVILRTLWVLHMKGLLCEKGADLLTSQAEKSDRLQNYERQLLYWGRYLTVTGSNATAKEVEIRLQNATIGIIGAGQLCGVTCDLLSRIGCGRINILTDGSDSNHEFELFASVADSITIERVELGKYGEGGRNFIEKNAALFDLLIVISRHCPRRALLELNRAAISNDVPTLFTQETPEGYDIGPLVIPRSSACLACKEAREISAHPFAIEEELYQKELEKDVAMTGGLGEDLVSSTFVATLIVAEIRRFITKIDRPTLTDRLVSVRHPLAALNQHSLVRVPRCEHCYVAGLQGARDED